MAGPSWPAFLCSRAGRVALALCLMVAAAPAPAAEPCTSNCARLSVGSGSGQPNQTVPVSLSFEQGPDDGEEGSGNDDVAAIAFTLGVPGNGEGDAPLVLPCVNSGDGSPNKLAPEAFQVGGAIADDFRVVIENAECVNRDSCLCPGAGQRRDDFVNVAVYGPKDIPEVGPVEIPILPDSALLMTLNFRVAAGAAPGTVNLRVFSDTQGGGAAKPSGSAYASIGDQSTVDVTVSQADRSQIAFADGQVVVEEAACAGDCDDSNTVAVNELVVGVNIALDIVPWTACPSFDEDGSHTVEIDELIDAVNNALRGCS